jgi:hypothetical protein
MKVARAAGLLWIDGAQGRESNVSEGRAMTTMRRIRWKRILLAAFFAEATVMAVFFLLLLLATVAGFPDIAKPMTTLDYIDAMVSSFVAMFLFTLWAVKRIESDWVLHGALIGVAGAVLFSVLWIATTGSLAQPTLYVVAHVLKVLGGITGGLVAERRERRVV